jgi:cyclopropane fatty-acyl-phospholipid synthase-like methyltransferase
MNPVTELVTLVRANGILWSAYFLVNRATAAVAAAADRRMQSREQRHQLPGINSVLRNRDVWNTADWSHKGEKWTPSEEWKDALVTDVMLPHLAPGGTVLEIGPGAGRWSSFLQRQAQQLILVDISERCLRLCREQFAECSNVSYLLVDSPSLPGLNNESVDFVWSFDVFVHIAPGDTASYLRELARVMRQGAVGVVHHPGQGRSHGGYRSAVTAESFAAMVKDAGLHFVQQFDAWGDRQQFDVRRHRDAITVFERR